MYDYSSLNDKELEDLSRDLLNASRNLQLQSFKQGRDGGIDLRYAGSSKFPEIIVQVKHYHGSTYASLKHSLKTNELLKLKKLNPKSYIVVTSLDLSPGNKDELTEILTPYVLTSDDILGKSDIDRMLVQHNAIERKWFKLWFSNTLILNRIINNGVHGRSANLHATLLEKLKLYVQTNHIAFGLEILKEKHVLIITGAPGVGKTTLSEMVLLDFIRREIPFIQVYTAQEAENCWTEEEEQLFYFDDFLGDNYLEIAFEGKKSSQMTRFIQRVRASSNKYFLLTTRTVILNQAKAKFEKYKRAKLTDIEFELVLHEYSKLDKAKILYNHLYHRKIPEHLSLEITKDEFYLEIIEHPNYTPRLIEDFTTNERIKDFTATRYREYILESLENPEEIWNMSYQNQIELYDRFLLQTLRTMEYKGIDATREAFESRLEYERNRNNRAFPENTFLQSMQTLTRGFLCIETNALTNDKFISFINPSLGDFLLSKVQSDLDTRIAQISSLKFLDQVEFFNSEPIESLLSDQERTLLVQIVKNEKISFFTRRFGNSFRRLKLLLDLKANSHDLLNAFDKLVEQKQISYHNIQHILNRKPLDPGLLSHIISLREVLMFQILGSVNYFDEVLGLKNVLNLLHIDYDAALTDISFYEILETKTLELAEEHAEELFEDESSGVFSDDDYEQLVDNIESEISMGIEKVLKTDEYAYWSFDNHIYSIEELIEENLEDYTPPFAEQPNRFHRIGRETTREDTNRQIRDLFS